MDGGLFNTPRPTDRRPATRPEPARQQAPPTVHKPVTQAASSSSKKSTKSLKRWPIIISILLALIVIAAAVWFFGSKVISGGSGVDSTKYQGVALATGQVYFGKMQFTGDYIKLTDVYYLHAEDSQKTSESTDTKEDTAGNDKVQLIKRGTEVHGPEETMFISKEQVLYYENLKPDGQVTKIIEEYKKK